MCYSPQGCKVRQDLATEQQQRNIWENIHVSLGVGDLFKQDCKPTYHRRKNLTDSTT